ncbi:ribosome silencing factor [Oceanicoccus sp. KOV_DT_Chl]|uniref:ribosome silencing factor n=1 Tax=Oceanicoccus sp. KOV_DT_Chl TaxID=1904639 RepID=UPI000C7E328A|nr:ribosome silencing factor [Oceanicoccus sp. KOV_DT_Chl]
MKAEQIKEIALEALDDLKGKDALTIDVREMTDMTDYMVICTGTSNRHVKSLADHVALELKKKGCPASSIEGDDAAAEWVLVDFGDVVVHVMLPDTRDFYDLERLWSVPAA